MWRWEQHTKSQLLIDTGSAAVCVNYCILHLRGHQCAFDYFSAASRMPKMNLPRMFLACVFWFGMVGRLHLWERQKAGMSFGGGIHNRDRSCLGFLLFHWGLLHFTRDQSDFQDVHCPEVLWGGTQTEVLGLTQDLGPWLKVLLLLYQKRKTMTGTS